LQTWKRPVRRTSKVQVRPLCRRRQHWLESFASDPTTLLQFATLAFLLLTPNLFPMNSEAHSSNPSHSVGSFELIERVANRLVGAAFSPHRHDTYTVALTMDGVQAFNYRGAMQHSLPGQVLVLHPEEVHDGHCYDEAGFSYQAAYAARLRTDRTERCPPIIPVLRRAHGRDRSVRTLAATPRAAAPNGTGPGAPAMTRHGSYRNQVAPTR
jgi:AraC-like ligand binding domain